MQLVDKYIYAIGQKLPIDARDEIKRELKSLLLDEIEESYGKSPSEIEIEKVITDFGSPSKVASRYRNKNVAIDGKFTNLFFMIIKIIIFAMVISFSVIFIIDLLTIDFSFFNVIKSIFKLFMNIISASLGAIGALTLTFMLITKFSDDLDLNLDGIWSVKDLDNIKMEEGKKSKVSMYVDIFCSVLFIALIQKMPAIVSYLETLFERTGINLGHYINPVVFKEYLFFIGLIMFLDILSNVIELVVESSKFLDIFTLITKVVNIALIFAMLFDTSLYLNFTTLFGVRGILLLISIITSLDFIGRMYTFIKKYVTSS